MMPSFPQLLLVLLLVVLLFGRGKISDLMGDVAKGIKSFKKGMADDEDDVAQVKREIADGADEVIDVTPKKDKAANG